MKISLNWLKEFVSIPKEVGAKKIADLLTLHTAEVEGVETSGPDLKNIVIGKITKIDKHPNADKLKICFVDLGDHGTKQIVCGGTNVQENLKVAVAMEGAIVKWHGEGDPIEIKNTKIRGIESFGMICAAEEIGLQKIFKHAEMEIIDLKDKGEIGQNLNTLFETDTILNIDNKSLTHRPDLWGHYGIAREVSAIFNSPLKKLAEFLVHKEPKNECSIEIDIRDDKICPRFSAVIIKGIKIEESPKWLKEKLENAGLNPINNIVDITNYVMLEIGEPMHAYDRNIVGGDSLIVRKAKKGEKIMLLDGNEKNLRSGDPVVCNKNDEILGLAGIMGGLKSGINDQTTEVILEAANWNHVLIRKTALFHGQRTEASQRFEKALDPNYTEIAIKRALNLLQKICPTAEIVSPLINAGKWQEKKLSIKINVKKIQEKIGVPISSQEISSILNRLEFGVSSKKDLLEIQIPSFRATKDINIKEDIVEEVARMYGYDKIPSILPALPIKLPLENIERQRKHKARKILSFGLKMDEIYCNSFYGENEIQKCLLNKENHLTLENYLSADQTHLRTSLVPNLLRATLENLKYLDEFKLFEIGRTYLPQGNNLPFEEKYICAAIVANKKDQNEIFYVIKGIFQEFINKFTAQKIALQKGENFPPYAHPKKALKIMLNNQEDIGAIFVLNPIVAQNFSLQNKIAFIELNFSKLTKSHETPIIYKPIPKFPGSHFDISVVTDNKMEAEKIIQIIKNSAEKLITKIELFDLFSDKEKLGENRKAMAFKIFLQAEDHTISEKENADTIASVINNLQKAGGEIRGI